MGELTDIFDITINLSGEQLLKRTRIEQLLAFFSIRQKLWAGSVIMLIILLLTVAIAGYNTNATQQKVTYLSHDIQPAFVAAMNLSEQIKQASTSMGFYLLTKEELHKDKYEKFLSNIDKAIVEFKQTAYAQYDEYTKNTIQEIEQLNGQFQSYKPRLIELTNTYDKNYIAVGFASTHLNPINQELLQAISSMILSEASEEASAKRKQLLLILEDMRYSWTSAVNNARVFLIYGNKDVLTNIKLYTDKVGELLEKTRAFGDLLTFEQAEYLPTVGKLRQQWLEKFNELMDIHQGEMARTDAYLIRTEIGPIMSSIDAALNKLLDQYREIMNDTNNQVINQATKTNNMVGSLFIFGLVFLTLVSWLMSGAISNPIKKAVSAMDDIADGDGDLTHQLNQIGHDEIPQLGAGFNRFVGHIREILQLVQHSSESIKGSAQELADITDDSKSTVQRQKQETDHIASAITEMSITAQEVLKHAVSVSDAANNANVETNDGRTIVNQTIESVQELEREAKNLAQMMQKLGSEIQNIGTVLDVIQNITEQTNLLALNAAIEAARAGEQGRGFAVVADEVRTLATRTTQSTHQIQSIVESIQSDTRLVMESASRNQKIAVSTTELAMKTGNSLEEIAAAVADATDKATQIATITQQQSAVAEEISKNVENITILADHTSQITNQVSIASQEQQLLAENLYSLVARFKL